MSSGMNKQCPECKQDFLIEPGFEFGAMYISYALNVAYFIATTIIAYLFFQPEDVYGYAMIDITIVLILLPFTLRISKVLNLYLMGGIKYHNNQEK